VGLGLVLGILIVAGGVIPLFHYWHSIGRVPGITPLEARELLLEADSQSVLVDVRDPEHFADLHLDGTHNWPHEEIIALESPADIPERFREGTLLMVSDSGVLSAAATQKLRRQCRVNAFDVRGGIEAWTASADQPGGVEVVFQSASAGALAPPFEESPGYEEAALASAILVIKPLYTLIAALLIVVLWRRRSPDMVALRWGLIFFFIGEGLCALDIAFFSHSSRLLQFFHGYGMVLSLGFATYAVLEALDLRVIGHSSPERRCAVLTLCRQCIKYDDVPCALRRLLYFVIPSLAVLACIPLLADTHSVSYNSTVFGLFVNHSHPVILQIFEIRYAPVYAIVLFLAALLVLLLRRESVPALSKVLLAAGIGSLGFGFLRLGLFSINQDNLVWFDFWEEVTELMYVAGVGLVLWVFRSGLSRTTGAGH
jgi:thiosulfate sulfurtransferase